MHFLKACFSKQMLINLVIAGIALVALAFCLGESLTALTAGVMPVLLIAACLIPCLAPMFLLRRRRKHSGDQPTPSAPPEL